MKSIMIFFIFLCAGRMLRAYPHIITWKNSPLVVFENGSNAVIKKNQQLKAPFFALTSRFDEVQFGLNTGNEITLMKNSKIQIYEVFENLDQEHIIFLIDGRIRLKNSKVPGSVAKANRIRTPFFDLTGPADSEVIVQLDMKEPSVEIKIVKGVWDVEFFSYEKKLHLISGQQVKFKGVLGDEPDQIKYDYLLEDKKIPKGALGGVAKFDVKKYELDKKIEDAELLKKEKIEMKKVTAAVQKKKKIENAYLCKKPFAKLDQCAWQIENDKCFRKRCNASGEWGDKTERPLTAACTSAELVGSCDY